MKMRYLVYLAALALAFNTSCGGKKNNGLTITVNPSTPTLVPGSGSFTFGGKTVTAPLFILNSVNVNWVGTSQLEVVTMEIKSPPNGGSAGSNSVSFTCNFLGDDLLGAFSAFSSTGNVIFPSNTQTKSTQLACTGLSLPSPVPDNLSIQAAVTIIGVLLDSNGNATGRVTSSQNITIQ